MLVPQLIPQSMKIRIMGPKPIMAQLMQKRIEYHFPRLELAFVRRVPQPNLNLPAMVGIQTEEAIKLRVEFTEICYHETVVSHDGRAGGGELPEGAERFVRARHPLQGFDAVDEAGHVAAGEGCGL
jgi:hypothetical protein